MCRHTTPIKKVQIPVGHRARLNRSLRREGLIWENILAHAVYSSGENYVYFENKDITSFIPAQKTNKGGPEGFQYFKKGNFWLGPRGSKSLSEIRKWKTET